MQVKPLKQGQLYNISIMEFLQVRYAFPCCHFYKGKAEDFFVNI